MPVKISAVEKNSYAEKAGITAGESIVSINGNIIKVLRDCVNVFHLYRRMIFM